MTVDVTVTLAHCRAARDGKGLCARGCRNWFKFHKLDWNRFLSSGYLASELRATGCGLAEIAIAVAEREARHGN